MTAYLGFLKLGCAECKFYIHFFLHSGSHSAGFPAEDCEEKKSAVRFLGTGCFAGEVCTGSLVGKLDMFHQHQHNCHQHHGVCKLLIWPL